MTTARPRIALLIMGSTRAGRVCPAVAAWVAGIGQARAGWTYETIDLADWPLPMDDEAALPALVTPQTPYAQPHTRAWSDKVGRADAVVFVTPQYNWGYPAALKNAIDHLYHEWRDKPVAIVTYGGHGGDRCARQLRQVAVALKMRAVARTPALRLPDTVIRQGVPLVPERDFARWQPQIGRALADLAALAEGRENLLARVRRVCKGWRAVV